MKENNEIFEKFWKNFKWPDPVAVEYRLYYDTTTGEPLFYSTDEHYDLDYIVIEQQQYNKYDHTVFVKDGVLHKKNIEVHTNKLVHSTDLGWQSHPENIEVLSANGGTQWKLKQLT